MTTTPFYKFIWKVLEGLRLIFLYFKSSSLMLRNVSKIGPFVQEVKEIVWKRCLLFQFIKCGSMKEIFTFLGNGIQTTTFFISSSRNFICYKETKILVYMIFMFKEQYFICRVRNICLFKISFTSIAQFSECCYQTNMNILYCKS